jgi:hypothetical protein
LADGRWPDREPKQVAAHVAVACLLGFQGVGVAGFGLLPCSSQAFEPGLASLLTPLAAFPGMVEYDPGLGVAAAECGLGDSSAVFPPTDWSTCFLHSLFEPGERAICQEW